MYIYVYTLTHIYIYMYVLYIIYTCIYTYTFIFPRVRFWFLPILGRLKNFEYFVSLNTSILRRFGRNQNKTLGEINLLFLIYMTQHSIQSLLQLKLK